MKYVKKFKMERILMDDMNWFKKHSESISTISIILTALITCMLWLNGKFNDIEKDIATIKTVLIMQKIMPAELAKNDKE